MKPHRITSLWAMLLPVGSALGDSSLMHVDVFTSGQEGYNTFRIPAIETAPDGTLLAFAEARKYNGADPGFHGNDIDLVYKRSTNGGKTWSPLTVLDDPGEKWSACNPATVVDRTTNRVWVFNVRTKPGRSSATARPGTDDAQAWCRFSADNGKTWSDPMDITSAAKDEKNWGGSFFGPGGAVQDQTGRLIAPLSRSTGRRNADGKLIGGPWNSLTIFSDDHGKTWKRGQLLPDGEWSSECQLVVLSDGRLLMDARQADGPHRWVAVSENGGETWSKPRPTQSLTRVACAIERYTLKSAEGQRDRIVWTGPKGPGRSNLVVRVSYDEGKTFPTERLISDEKAAYSDLTVLKDKSVGVLWERGGYRFLTFTRFGLAFLEPDSAQPEK